MSSSFLQMSDIYVEKFSYKLNPGEGASEDEKIPIEVSPVLKIDSINHHRGVLELHVNLFDDNQRDSKVPFYLSMIVVAHFIDNDEHNQQDVFSTYLPSAISMVYSYVRAYISGVTGLFGGESVHIPTINVLKLLEDSLTDN